MPHLRDIVSTQPLDQPELPLIHTSRCEYLNGFVLSKTISPRPCTRFSEDLIYFFYGRPAYRSSKGTKPSEPIDLCPLCFVFKPATIPKTNVRRVFPCDTGAMKDRIFEPDLNWADQIDLALAPTIESARQLVSLCFHDNASYYFGKLSPTLSPDPGSTFERYCTLIKRAPTERADDRRSAIEVQVNGSVHLSGQLLFVALPREFFSEASIKDAVENHWKCEAICYPTFIGGAPAEYYSVVRDRITMWLEQKGYL